MAEKQDWELDGCVWSQDSETALFAPKALAQTFDSGFALGARSHSECSLGCSPLPRQFAYCPACGSRLDDPPQIRSWRPPYGDLSGTKLVATPFAELPLALGDLQLPGRGSFVFFAEALAGFASGLFALDREGALWFLNGDAKAWREVAVVGAGAPATSLALRSWSIGVPVQGSPHFFAPTVLGPAKFQLDIAQGTLGIATGEGECLGGGACLGLATYFPVLRGGSLQITSVQPTRSGNDTWTSLPVSGEPDVASPELNAPIVEESRRRVIWMGRTGALVLDGRNVGDVEASARFSRWPDGWVACLEFGPPYMDSDGLWQMCFSEEHGYAYIKLGTGVPVVRVCDGPRLSTGRASFRRTAKLRAQPWADPKSDEDDDRIVFPLMECQANGRVLHLSIDFRDTYSDFFASDAKSFFELKIEGIPGLLTSGQLRRPYEAQCFIYQDMLHFYHPERESVLRWKVAHA